MLISRILAFSAGLLGATSTASSADFAPGDFAVAPPGTNLAVLYLKASQSEDLHNRLVGDIPDSKLSTAVGVLRFARYTEIADTPWAFQAVLPFGGFPTARIGGVDQEKAQGLGDVTVAATAFPLNGADTDPYGTTLALTLFIGAPTGSYERGEVSLGSGTWTFTPQAAVVQGLGGDWFFEGSIDAAIQPSRSEDGIRLSRDPSWQAQAYLRRKLSDETSISVGYSGLFGGESFEDGLSTGGRTRSDQARLFANHWLTPTTQIQGMIATDLSASGGFRQDVNAELRFVKVF